MDSDWSGSGIWSEMGTAVDSPYPRITSATMGKVVDMGLSDPFNMGGAMAPAAVDTIQRHLFDLKLEPSYYDLIITGDLAEIGRNTALDLFKQKGLIINEDQFQDCGLMVYGEDQEVFAGGSGPACSATVMYGHYLNRMKEGLFKRILVRCDRCFAVTAYHFSKRKPFPA